MRSRAARDATTASTLHFCPQADPKIAIEIDGHAKSADGGLSTPEAQDRYSQRQNEITSAGWQILRFTNAQVQTRSGECRRQIENALHGYSAEKLARYAMPDAVVVEASDPPPPPAQEHPASSDLEDRRRRASDLAARRAEQQRADDDRAASRRKAFWIGGAIAVAVVAVTVGLTVGDDAPTSADPSSADPSGSTCPEGFKIKGNVSQGGEKIFHKPGWQFYSQTDPEACFATAKAAEADGYRASQVR